MPAETGSVGIVVVVGSVRPGNYTSKAVGLVLDELEKISDVRVDVVDPTGMDLPLPGTADVTPAVKSIRASLGEATGVIFATPEYHGSYSSVVKLLLDNLGFPSELSGKPIALLGVASGVIGAVKALEHLRSVCSHVGGIVLPGPCSVANVREVFDEHGNCLDPQIEKQIRGVPVKLLDFIHRSVCPWESLEETVRGSASAE
ncbi:MAG: NAD(P)H-dependent oxidoreductase [Gemmatimonadota bacterium]|nr:MAG: NAD(P)H-dependent oxidoreductase [Gemmatimonadota bacterium]